MFALLLAVLRSLPGPVFFPLRALAIVYADFFRGVPTILVIRCSASVRPALGLAGVPTSTTFWGIVALVLVYTAYVSEVYRAGIESVHPSQEAAARSLGLTQGQTLRHVVLPQAVRRVIPPLLNDFIGLQKDTALVGRSASIEAFKQTQIDQARRSTSLPCLAAAALFVAVTIPLARFTDWLVARDRRRAQAQGGVRVNARGGARDRGAAQVVREGLVLDGIDLSVAEHEVVCLIGASGLGQVDAASLRQPARADRRGPDRRRTARRSPRPAST